ncbi:TetR family transcriptional regulator [Herbaspirillum frisingense GSF30]|uniref:TetR family transcriptional regulator n=1 Tax=Herbaspirillum frisingense GSF30 TaxID=864073 RepID=A0AAI9N3H0_9BURK|nr:TetR/AcrR family transcriptional regulator [Herbaspirillum frisingense]EOA04357.1 TetR family transcriptional regulator [Herbaspirillum frisingense GSF30]
MKKSKQETLDTRKRILSTATRMFLADGLAETGIASIMSAAGLTQGGFYRHFRSKEQLIAEANLAANDRMFDFFSQALAGLPPRQALATAVDMYLSQLDGAECGGMCPLPNLGSELRRADRLVRGAAMAGYQRLVQFFQMLATRAGAPDPARLAEAVVTTMVGAVMLARVAINDDSQQAILANCRKTLHAMLPPVAVAD